MRAATIFKMGNKERKVVRAENNDPINFTCGVCKQVHPYVKEAHLECPNKEVNESATQTNTE